MAEPKKEKIKKRRGDRRDAVWLRDLDPMHAFTPYMFPDRCDNEAFISLNVDMTAMEEFLAKKNAGSPEHPYTFFHLVAMALVKAFVLRPKMNRFVKGNRMYQRRVLTLSFVVKKAFKDDAHEALAFLYGDENTTLETLHEALVKEITTCRGDEVVDTSTAGMDLLTKLPRPVMRMVMGILNRMDYHGTVPDFLAKTDPNHASIFISNLGSIGLKAGYHHLTNWGTTSLFVVIGRKKKAPIFADDGSYVMHDVLPLGLTLDERIADGYYYSKTVKLLEYLLAHPEELEKPASTPVDF